MNQIQTWEHPVSIPEYAQGTALFNKLVLSDRRTYLWMLRAFTRTICGRVSHAILNEQQEKKFPDAPVIVSFAPGFQLDAQAYPNMIEAFNTQGVPVFTSPSLPQGFQAFKYNPIYTRTCIVWFCDTIGSSSTTNNNHGRWS